MKRIASGFSRFPYTKKERYDKMSVSENKRFFFLRTERNWKMDFTTERMLHGGDYNPEQWLDRPDLLEKDLEMLQEEG